MHWKTQTAPGVRRRASSRRASWPGNPRTAPSRRSEIGRSTVVGNALSGRQGLADLLAHRVSARRVFNRSPPVSSAPPARAGKRVSEDRVPVADCLGQPLQRSAKRRPARARRRRMASTTRPGHHDWTSGLLGAATICATCGWWCCNQVRSRRPLSHMRRAGVARQPGYALSWPRCRAASGPARRWPRPIPVLADEALFCQSQCVPSGDSVEGVASRAPGDLLTATPTSPEPYAVLLRVPVARVWPGSSGSAAGYARPPLKGRRAMGVQPR